MKVKERCKCCKGYGIKADNEVKRKCHVCFGEGYVRKYKRGLSTTLLVGLILSSLFILFISNYKEPSPIYTNKITNHYLYPNVTESSECYRIQEVNNTNFILSCKEVKNE